MTPEVLDILCRHYRYPRTRRAAAVTGPESDKAAAEGFPVDQQQTFTHDDVVRRARHAVTQLSEADVTAAFVAGVGGSALRGRQVLISFLWARHLPEHPYEGTYGGCEVCGMMPEQSIDVTEERLRLRLGWAWNEMPARYVVDLEDAVQTGLPKPAAGDRAVLTQLLVVVAAMPPKAPPSQLEKELGRARTIPRTEKYKRLGILEALAEAGVLPNQLIASSYDRFVTRAEGRQADSRLGVSHRSDIVLPFGAWRGADGVDWERARQLFGITEPTPA